MGGVGASALIRRDHHSPSPCSDLTNSAKSDAGMWQFHWLISFVFEIVAVER